MNVWMIAFVFAVLPPAEPEGAPRMVLMTSMAVEFQNLAGCINGIASAAKLLEGSGLTLKAGCIPKGIAVLEVEKPRKGAGA